MGYPETVTPRARLLPVISHAKARIALALATALTTATVTAAQAPKAALDTTRINAVFKQYHRKDSPGCALGVYRNGIIAYARGYGMADLERGVPITPATLFDLGSTSKQFTAASIALLVADGKLSFQDAVRKYLPEIPDYGATITLDHLVRHTSGIRDYAGLLSLAGWKLEDVTTDDDAIQIIARQRALNFPPGTKWDYSNSGFFLLSIVVQRVTGKNLAEFAKERIFTPLGMTNTHFRNDHNAILPGRALGYSPLEKGGFRNDMSSWDQLGDGAVQSSVEELVKWDRNFYTPTVGGQALLDRLQEPGTLSNGKPHGYGRGLFLDTYRGVRRVQHGGAWAGYRAMLMRFPEQRTSFAVLCNVGSANTSKLAEGAADVVLGGAFRRVEVVAGGASSQVREADSAKGMGAGSVDPHRFEGIYFAETEQSVIRVVSQGGGLAVRAFGTIIPLKPAGLERFRAERYPLEIEFSGPPDVPASAARMGFRGEEGASYVRVAAASPGPDRVAELAGTYYSPELDASWKILVKEGRAVVSGRGIGEDPLDPVFEDAFTAGPSFLRFTRDAAGKIAGFEASASRMQRIRFERGAGNAGR